MDLRLDALRVVLAGRPVLDGVSATLAAGRVTAILGPNGAGKSTLLRTIAALVPCASGGVTLDGREVAALDPRARARLIGYLPQDAAVHWNIAASEVVALGRLPHRAPFAAPSAHDLEAAMAAMAATGTLEFADRPVNALSGGERARVLLARVLAGEPAWLLADEPLAGLDPAHQFDMLDRMRDIARAGSGVAIVLHDLAHAARIADDVLLLRDGRIAAHGPIAETLTTETIAAVFGVEAHWIDHDGAALLVPLGRMSRSVRVESRRAG